MVLFKKLIKSNHQIILKAKTICVKHSYKAVKKFIRKQLTQCSKLHKKPCRRTYGYNNPSACDAHEDNKGNI